MFVIFQFTTALVMVITSICHAKAERIEPVVVLRDLSNGHNVVGKNIQLECQTTFYAKYVSIKWKTPEHVKNKNVGLKENANARYVTTSTLVIHEAETKHSGLYFCEVIHKQMNYTLATKKMTITVYEVKDEILKINTEHITKSAHAEVEIQVKAHPNVFVSWVDGEDELIKNSSNITVSLESTPYDEEYNYKAKLTFNYVTSNDLRGLYVIFVGNGVRTLSHSFEMYPTNFINVHLELVSVNEDEMAAKYQCTALGNPKPNITWIFEPCGILQCLHYKGRNSNSTEQFILKELTHEDRGLEMVSYISVNLTDVGMLKCVSQDVEATEPSFYTQNGFDFFSKTDDFGNSKYQKLYAGYFETLVAMCSRSLYKYSPDVLWYHNGKIINTRDPTYFEYFSYNLLNKVVNVLSMDYVLEDQLGNFSCQVFTRTGKVESKTVEVVSKNMSNLYPEISLEDLNGGHSTVGQDIRLVCSVTFYINVSLGWIFFRTQDREEQEEALQYANGLYSSIEKQKISVEVNETVTNRNTYTTTSYLTISSANVGETGYYGCKTEDNKFYNENFIWVRIYDLNETSLVFEQKNDFDNENMNIKILITAHPPPTVKWFDNFGTEIFLDHVNTSNFLISSNQIINIPENNANYVVTLTFKSLNTRDFGNYTIVVENGYEKIEHSVQVNVTGVPTAKIDIYNMSTGNTTFKCRSTGYPKPTIEWYFKKCTTLKCCLEVDIKSHNTYLHLNELWNENSGLQNISYVSVNLSERGVLVCRTENSFGQNYTYEPILGFDIEFEMSLENPDNIEYSNKTIYIIGEKKMKFICAASKLKYTNKFAWTTFGYQYDSHQIYYFDDAKTPASLDFLSSSFYMRTEFVNSPSENYYSCSVLRRDNGILSSQTYKVESHLSAYVTIYKTNMANNSVEVDLKSKWKLYCYAEGFPAPTVKWYKNSQNILDSEKLKLTNEGQVLEMVYVDPDDEGIYKCEVSNKYSESVKYISLNVVIKNQWLYVQIILVLLALFFITVLAVMKFRKEKKMEKKLKLLGLFYLEKDSWNKISSKLSTENEDVLLPFDRKWEIPFKNIKIGKRLGSGAFGITYQANVINFFPNDPNKTVAVKTVNSSSGFECAKALVSELKILSHLGSHVNIVNFLGACTQHILKDELYVVLEFCSFGNLLDHISRYSRNFIDQKDYDSDTFNWTGSGNTDAVENSNHGDSVCTKNFLIWSFQIARGMEYLSFRRVVHGDLAARNILLTDENVVKVCDFGLAKNVYNYGKYVKKSKGPLPLKWMAVEAIEKGIFSTQSDVWSFGIVLWEFFSLGKIPYSGVDVDENFCKKLINGYRMESPDAATTKIHNIMLACWQLDPELRPSFSDLAEQIGSFLEEPVKNRYVEMNSPYVLMNQQQFDGRFDYLTMVNPITCQNVVSRHYENYHSFRSSDSTEDELEAN